MLLFDATKVIEKMEAEPEIMVEFNDFLNKYKSPYNERSELKGIPNTPEALKMVDLYRELVLRTNGMTTSYHSGLEKNKVKFTVRLKGRGPRAVYKDFYGTHYSQHLPHQLSKTFALYHHMDY